MFKRRIIVTLVATLSSLSCFASGGRKASEDTVATSESQKESVPMVVPPKKDEIGVKNPATPVTRQLLVAFKDAEAAQGRAQIFASLKVKEIEQVGPTPLYLIEISENDDLKEVQKKITQKPGVRYAEPNMQFRILNKK